MSSLNMMMNQNEYPNWRDQSKEGGFQQTCDGFGFSNFRCSTVIAPNGKLIRQDQLPVSVGKDQLPVSVGTGLKNPEAALKELRSDAKLFPDKYGDYQLYEETNKLCVGDENDYVINRTINTNPLMKLFFSRENVDHVLYLICKLVRKVSPEYQISPESQSKPELLTIFRSIYFQLPTNPYGTPEQLREQVDSLNRAVLNWTVPQIIINIQSYLGYVHDQPTHRKIMDRPMNMSNAGTRTDPVISSRWY